MKQRINLYNPHKSKKKFELLSLQGSVTVAIAVITVVLLCGLGLNWYASEQERTFAKLQNDKVKIDEAVSAEQARFSSLQVQPEILAEQQRLKDEIAARKALQSLLHKVQPAQSVNFSSYLYALADASLTESWLSQFVLDNGNRSFALGGGAVDGPSVASMIESIASTEEFQGMNVNRLTVNAEGSGVRFEALAELRSYE
ncbi:hypothetical protein ACMXYX_17065 [Neptuniibacter sp. QD72_48]|uniref:hypothetical protein n=1 Tax=Neptuniibacter sp. QD72_48 TaxID=3398214 RepID=UPI0039F51842